MAISTNNNGELAMADTSVGDADSIDRRTVVKALAAGAATVTMNARGAADTRPADVVVETAAGKVRGVLRNDACAFMGVPYGASTAGAGRFMPPGKPASWAGIREPVVRRLIAPQTNPLAPPAPAGMPVNPIIAAITESGATESEDCLNLCIWTPRADSSKRPVMVWLHGGGYSSGSGSNPAYDGARLSAHGDVVVVNVTHRLNVLGYTYLGELGGPEFASSGNAGSLDIVAALQWVHTNIERFGGDPGKVLIFGESGGGGKVSTALSMPATSGLVHRAVIQSGSVRKLTEKPEATRVATALLAELGLKPNQLRELQQLPLEKVMAAHFATLAKVGGGPMSGFSPVLDGVNVLRHPFDPIANPLQAGIPLLIGSNMTETTLFAMLGDPQAFALDDAALAQRLKDSLGVATAPAALALYRRLHPQASPSDLFFLISSDRSSGFRRGAIQIAEAKAAQGQAPVYLYELLWKTPAWDGKLRTPHGLDVSLVFNNPGSAANTPLSGGNERAQRMAAVMSDAWIAFARNGSPQTAGLPWPAYTLEKRSTMLFDETSRAENDPFRATRVFWDDVSNVFM